MASDLRGLRVGSPGRPVRDRKRFLWLMGADRAHRGADHVADRLGAQSARLARARRRCPFWIGPILVYIVLPLLDWRYGPDGENPPDEAMERLENDKYYRYCTYIFIPFQYATVVIGAYLFTAGDLSWLGFDGGLELGRQDRASALGRA